MFFLHYDVLKFCMILTTLSTFMFCERLRPDVFILLSFAYIFAFFVVCYWSVIFL